MSGVVVVAGATQGARAINRAVLDAVPVICTGARLFHVTGNTDLESALGVRDRLAADLQQRYVVAPFRDDLPIVMLAADVGVFRAGASVLGEIPAAGLPSILVPGRYAGAHQRDNARWLEQGGAAEVLEEDALATLGDRILGLLSDRPRLAAMREAATALARPDAADAIADLIVEVAKR